MKEFVGCDSDIGLLETVGRAGNMNVQISPTVTEEIR